MSLVIEMVARTILLVEDNPYDVEFTRRAFTKSRIANQLVVAKSGEEALDFLFGTGAYAGRDVSELPALTLLDLKLPRLQGIEVLRSIRADGRTKTMPVAVLTTFSDQPEIAIARDLGAKGHIRKPVDFGQLMEVVSELHLSLAVVDQPAAKAD